MQAQDTPNNNAIPEAPSEAVSGETAPTIEATPSLEEMIRQAELKAAEHHDAWLRAKAETENVRRRAQDDISKAHKFAVEKFAGELLAVKDSLEAALAVPEQTVESFKSGVELTLKQLVAAFEKNALIEVNPAGEKFDPHKHQAIGMVDSDDLIEPTMFATLYSAVQVDGVRLAACAGDCIDADGKKIEGRMVTIRQGGVRDAQELLLEAFQTGSFYGPLSWNKLFDARLFKEKGIHYDETMLFGDDASVLHRVFEGERCNCLGDVLYHYRTRAGQITTAGFPPRKTDDLRMYWEWLQYFSARPGREEYYDWAVVRYWKIFYQFWCQSDAAGNLPEVRPKFMAHKKHLDAILPDILASKYLPLGEKLRAAAFCASPTLTYGAAAAWGRLHTRKGK